MEQAKFSKLFGVNMITVQKRHYTDCRSGCPSNYIARLRVGSAVIATETERMEFSAGDVFFIPKGLPYQSYWIEGTSWDSFRFDFFPATDERQYGLQKIPCERDEIALIEEIAQIGTADTLAVGLLFTLFGRLQPRMCCSPPTPRNALLQRVLIYMEQNPDCTVPMIAQECSVSVSGLYALFRKTLGRTPTDQKHRLQCERAAELLTTTDLSVEEISERLGFSSSSYFRKILFAETGKTPTAIRKSAQLI